MQEVSIYQVDAFTSKAFGGNPAAICPVDSFPDDEVMQAIARENNLSETAFIVPVSPEGVGEKCDYYLRWFTPTIEVDLCGHATLAAAYVVFTHLEPGCERVRFETRSGCMLAVKDAATGRIHLHFPRLDPKLVSIPDGLTEALGVPIMEVRHRDRDFLIRCADERMIERMHPNMTALEALAPFGFIVTAPAGEQANVGKETDPVDFVSRCFFPNHGIPEDPVTGSAHCLLTPYWAEQLGKERLHALQISKRGGELWLQLEEAVVVLAGECVETMRGTLLLR